MDLIFNELSLTHKADDKFNAQKLMENLLHTCKTARNTGDRNLFNRLRVAADFTQWLLSENYTINDWLNDRTTNRKYKELFLGFKRFPYIDENDENVENAYVGNYYFLYSPDSKELHLKESEGLAVAFLYNTISVSLETHRVWDGNIIEIIEKIENKEKTVEVKHGSCPDHINLHYDWIVSKCPIVLVETDILSKHKEIKLRDDHGKDLLKHYANRLINSPYVIGIVNSLPFNPNQKRMIKKIYPDGKIEIVFKWTDQGYGFIVQSTGRNLQETKAIADIISEMMKP